MKDHRETLFDVCEAFMGWEHGEPEPKIEYDGKQATLRQALGLMWNDTMIIPNRYRTDVTDILEAHRIDRRPETIGTYAVAARLLMPLVKAAAA